MRQRWWRAPVPWAGALAGLGLGLFDYGILHLMMGVDVIYGKYDVTEHLFAIFAVTFGALGYAIGWLWWARGRLRHNAATIEAQMEALRDSQAEALEHQRRAMRNEQLAGLGQMAAGVAHEVRNPLAVIRGSASVLLEGAGADGDEDQRRAAQFVCDEVDRLDRFVRGLLDVARPLEPARARCLASELATLIWGQLPVEQAARLQVEMLGEPAAELALDPELGARIVCGLVANACGVMEEEGVGSRVLVEIEPRVIRVRDDGPGIGADDAARIFEPFFTTRPGGTGLGLAMARRMAQAMGAELVYDDRGGAGPAGRGACFRLELQEAR